MGTVSSYNLLFAYIPKYLLPTMLLTPHRNILILTIITNLHIQLIHSLLVICDLRWLKISISSCNLSFNFTFTLLPSLFLILCTPHELTFPSFTLISLLLLPLPNCYQFLQSLQNMPQAQCHPQKPCILCFQAFTLHYAKSLSNIKPTCNYGA